MENCIGIDYILIGLYTNYIILIYKVMFMRIVKDLIGKEVLDSDVNNMGIVDDIEFDKESNEILSLVLKRKGISNTLRASKSEDIVPFDLVKTIGDKIILKDSYDI